LVFPPVTGATVHEREEDDAEAEAEEREAPFASVDDSADAEESSEPQSDRGFSF